VNKKTRRDLSARARGAAAAPPRESERAAGPVLSGAALDIAGRW
jgi:hypothetical protein